MKLSEITPIQILGGILVVNTVLAGGTAQLTDLFGATMANHILSVSILGSGICGGFIMNMGGLPSQATQVRNVLAMPGVEKIAVNAQASPALATLAVDPLQDKIAPTPAAMDKVTATARTVASILLIAFMVSFLVAGRSAQAQTPRLVKPTGNIVNDIAAATGAPKIGLTGAPVTDLQNFFNSKLLPDLQYSLKLAQAAKNTITADCYQAWIDIITTQQTAVKNPDGTDIAMPDPHIITEFEKLVELRNALQPESTFNVKCSPVASMIKKDLTGLIGTVLAGGAGLATLVPGL